MRMKLALAILCVLPWKLAAAQSFSGIWSGTFTVQPDRVYDLHLAVNQGSLGDVIGVAVYPKSGCSSRLILTALEPEFKVAEQFLSGPCKLKTSLILKNLDLEHLDLTMLREDGSLLAQGTLSKMNVDSDNNNSVIDESLIGYWTGYYPGTSMSAAYSIDVTIVASELEKLAAVVTYKDLGCGGVWQLKDSQDGAVRFLESLDYFSGGNCVPAGEVKIKRNADGTLTYTWNGSQSTILTRSNLLPKE